MATGKGKMPAVAESQETTTVASTSIRPVLEPALSGAAGLDVINQMIHRQVHMKTVSTSRPLAQPRRHAHNCRRSPWPQPRASQIFGTLQHGQLLRCRAFSCTFSCSPGPHFCHVHTRCSQEKRLESQLLQQQLQQLEDKKTFDNVQTQWMSTRRAMSEQVTAPPHLHSPEGMRLRRRPFTHTQAQVIRTLPEPSVLRWQLHQRPMPPSDAHCAHRLPRLCRRSKRRASCSAFTRPRVK